jgi:hypothetical protein
MGISLATFGVAAAVDSTKVQANRAKLADAARKLAANPNDLVAEKDRQELPARIVAQKTEGFFKDITTSADGASLHRLQFMVWTLALAVVFVVTVWRTIGMPDFDATMLGLMGITSGTYAGLKLPENKA